MAEFLLALSWRFNPLIIIAFLLSNATSVFCDKQDFDIEALEQALERIGRESDVTPLIDDIESLINKPINLKSAKPSDFLKIPGISLLQSKAAVKYIHSMKALSKEDLVYLLNLDSDVAYIFNLCTTLKDDSVNQYSSALRLRYTPSLQSTYGFETGAYKGNKVDYYGRAIASYGAYSLNLLADKDEGERGIYDFASASLSGSAFGVDFIAGDYLLEAGMGTILWKPFGLRKGAQYVSAALQIGQGASQYRSSLDYSFFRGLCVGKEMFWGNAALKITAWISSLPRSATLDSARNVATSIRTSGYNRSQHEIDTKNNISESTAGALLEWESAFIRIGAAAFNLEYSKTIESESKTAFIGKEGFFKSIYGTIELGNTALGCELAADGRNYLGFKAGLQHETEKWAAAVAYRLFPKEFRSPFGYNFGESYFPTDERGIYSAITVKSFKNIQINIYTDFFRSDANFESSASPLRGFDSGAEIEFSNFKPSTITIRAEYEDKSDYGSDSQGKKTAFQKRSSSIRADLRTPLSKNFTFKSRGEFRYCTYEYFQADETGAAFFAELAYKDEAVSLGCRLTYFATDSYNSAIWQYEAFIPGMMSNSVLYGKGMRTALFSKWNFLENATLSTAFSLLNKANTDVIGSGTNAVEGSEKVELILQFDWNL